MSNRYIHYKSQTKIDKPQIKETTYTNVQATNQKTNLQATKHTQRTNHYKSGSFTLICKPLAYSFQTDYDTNL